MMKAVDNARKQLRVYVGNKKGGVGKTTISVVIATILAVKYGLRVLLVDVDPDSDAAVLLGADPMAAGTRELLLGEVVAPIATAAETLWLLPAGAHLDGADVKALEADDLKEALDTTIDQFDVIIIDSPPGETELRRMAIRAANVALIPINAHPLSVYRMCQVLREIEEYQKRGKPAPSATAVVVNQIDRRRRLDRTIGKNLQEGIPTVPRHDVRTSSSLAQATGEGILVTSDPLAARSQAMEDLLCLVGWLIQTWETL